MARCLAALMLLFVLPNTTEAASSTVDHIGGALGGVGGGLACGSGTAIYSALRAAGHDDRSNDPMLWRETSSGGVLAALFAEHAAVGGAAGSLEPDPEHGFLVGAAISCTLDVAWIIGSEVIASHREPSMSLLERGPRGWRLGVPGFAARRGGGTLRLLALQF